MRNHGSSKSDFQKSHPCLGAYRKKDGDAQFVYQCSVTAKKCAENQSRVDVFIITNKFGVGRENQNAYSYVKLAVQIWEWSLASTLCIGKEAYPQASLQQQKKTGLGSLLPEHISQCHDQNSNLISPFPHSLFRHYSNSFKQSQFLVLTVWQLPL